LESLLDWLFTVKIIERTGELAAVSSKSALGTKSKNGIRESGSQKKSNADKLLLDSIIADFALIEKVKQIASVEGYKLFDIQRKINDYKPNIKKKIVEESKVVNKKPAKKSTSINKRRSPN
jgi:hypothetical protein